MVENSVLHYFKYTIKVSINFKYNNSKTEGVRDSKFNSIVYSDGEMDKHTDERSDEMTPVYL